MTHYLLDRVITGLFFAVVLGIPLGLVVAIVRHLPKDRR